MQTLNKLWQLLSSTRLALYLLSAITMAAAAGMLVKIAKGPLAYWYLGIPVINKLGLQNVFATRWFLALSLVFLVNTTVCTINQVFKARRLHAAAGKRRPPVSIWASPIFHMGLIITVLGALISQGTRMSGKFIITAGQIFNDRHQNYVTLNEGPLFDEDHGAFQVALEKVILGYSPQGLPDTISSRLTVLKNGMTVKIGEINFNKPLTSGNLKFYQYSQFGYATGIRVLDRNDYEIGRFRTVLETKYKPSAYEFTGKFAIPGTGDVAEARFYPAIDPATRIPRQKTYKPDYPGLALTVQRDGQRIFQGMLSKGSPVTVGEYRLVFDHYLLWSGITVVRDPGLYVIYTGFWIAVAGLGLMYIANPQMLIRKGGKKGD